MKVIFNNEKLQTLYDGTFKGKPMFAKPIIEKFIQRVETMANVTSSTELLKFRSLNFEALKGDLKGFYSIRVNKQHRILFRIEADEILVEEIAIIESLSNHYQ
jgi:plasmid maintenance system killer protein